MIFVLALVCLSLAQDLNQGFIPGRMSPPESPALSAVDIPSEFDWGSVNGKNYLTLA